MSPAVKHAPPLTGRRAARVMGTIDRAVLPLFVDGPVFDEIINFSQSDTSREIGGFLLGGHYADRHEYVEINAFLPAANAFGDAVSLTFTHDTWSKLNNEIEREHPELKIVGWHHTHPGLGIFLSQYDRFIHQNFFSQTYQVAMVVDPRQHEFGFFQWSGPSLVNSGFLLVANNSKRKKRGTV